MLKPMPKTILWMLCMFFFHAVVTAQMKQQDTLKTIQAKPAKKANAKRIPPAPGEALGFVAGLNGVGVQFGFHPKWKKPIGFRIVSTFTPLELQQSPVTYTSYNLAVKLSGQFQGTGVYADYRPAKLPFRLVGGLHYLQTQFTLSARQSASINAADLVITPETFGEIQGIFSTGKIVPYAGIGFGRTVSRKRIGMGLDLGGFYLGKPNVTMVSTGMLEPTAEANKDWVEKTFAPFSFFPQMNFHLHVKITK
jgi:hypothetical protein